MNKLAAEKIASEYYGLGVKLAQDKLANVIGKGIHAGMAGSIAATGALPALYAGSEAVARKLAPGTFSKVDKLKRLSTLSDDVVGMTPYNKQDTINQIAINMGFKPGPTAELEIMGALQNTLGKKVNSPQSFVDLFNRDNLRAFREAKPDLFKGIGEIPSSDTVMKLHFLKTPGLDNKGLTLDKLKALKAEAAKAVDEFGGELTGLEDLIQKSPAVLGLGGSAIAGRKLYKALNRQAGYK